MKDNSQKNSHTGIIETGGTKDNFIELFSRFLLNTFKIFVGGFIGDLVLSIVCMIIYAVLSKVYLSKLAVLIYLALPITIFIKLFKNKKALYVPVGLCFMHFIFFPTAFLYILKFIHIID
ncbi:hypothetical protein [Acetivibrio cellulolyticus]|uniref:hypothetical protein n=1 Tax=Acetivibrio cellulolyticus TaxID=35830 RepID=UPI0001E2C743|nr:hypothetical protein [Acetivibrio cellulolyticus]